ncbi:hypothetical protein NW762_003967 [Fusarium torreyae]|uniref:tyrosinase n=1 Tax=Fusarium torreyae TaxID=1237075 RepID=A0A9W8S551_9HYPO|nr:hypothetical protein NW762_003967 [Fusarium torreyae]
MRLQSLMEIFSLVNGMEAVLHSPGGEDIVTGPLKELFGTRTDPYTNNALMLGMSERLPELARRISTDFMEEQTRIALTSAVESITFCVNDTLASLHKAAPPELRVLFWWPMKVLREFLDLAVTGHPLALVILAYYDILLVWGESEYWFFEDWAENLINAIVEKIFSIIIGGAFLTSGGTYGIKGLPRPPNAVRQPGEIPYVSNLPVRKEISTLTDSDDSDERKQGTLFVLALERFKLMSVSEKLSYFQIASIHGFPEVAWDGVPELKHAPDAETNKAGDQPSSGYYNHNSLNFPAWHWPSTHLGEYEAHHLRLGEQNGFSASEAEDWYAVAETWRMPYWDWARHQKYIEDLVCPQILTQGPVHSFPPHAVKDYHPPSGLYANPFWNFENPEKDEKTGKPLPFGTMPDNKERWNIKDNQIVHDEFPLQEACDWAPGYNTTWGQFASTKWIAEGNGCPETGYISLGYIHNNIHNLTGGSDYATGMGHMSDVPVAAFDPIFWLHHVQIDRLLAIRQCLNPKLWFDKKRSYEPDSTGTKGPHVADDKETDPLEPFHRKNNDQLNYQYDDLAELANKNVLKHGRFIKEEYKKELRAHVNSIYPGTGYLIQEMNERNEMPDGFEPSNGKTGEWHGYISNVAYDRYAMDGLSYTIDLVDRWARIPPTSTSTTTWATCTFSEED